MADGSKVLDQARSLIEERLKELDDERKVADSLRRIETKRLRRRPSLITPKGRRKTSDNYSDSPAAGATVSHRRLDRARNLTGVRASRLRSCSSVDPWI